MMSQQFQQPEPPNKFKTFMKDIGWPILIPTIAGIFVFVATIWIGKIRIINFNWLMLILGLVMLAITMSFVWYSVRTRVILQSKYHDDIVTLKKEQHAFQYNSRDMINYEFNRLNEWAISYSQENAKEQKERFEELKTQCMEAISDAKNASDGRIQNTEFNFVGAIQSYERALDSQKQYLLAVIQAKFEEIHTTRLLPDEQEVLSTSSERPHNGV